jgi:hypothetical protein
MRRSKFWSGQRAENVDKYLADILRVFHNHNLFHEGVELIGSWCFKLYQKHLGVKEYPLRTIDIDFLVPIPYRGAKHENFVKELEEIGFRCGFNTDGSMYFWNSELKIEFIVPEKGRGAAGIVHIRELGLKAIPLRFVNLLLDNPIFVSEDNMEILLPNPVNFCLHKLLIASRRKSLDKNLKDIEQALYTSAMISDYVVSKLFDSLPKSWRQKILITLEHARTELPLLRNESERLLLVLQEDEKQMK